MRIKVPGAPKNILDKALQKAKKHSSFFTHDNGGRPIAVKLFPDENVVKIFLRKYSTEKESYKTERKPIFIFNRVSTVFIGYGILQEIVGRFAKRMKKFLPETLGNAFGIVQTNDYGFEVFTYIGISIEKLRLGKGEKVIRYQSMVGNNDVPYGFLLTSKGVYSFISNNCENAFIPTEKLIKAFGSLEKIPLRYSYNLPIDLWCAESSEMHIKPEILIGRVSDLTDYL